MALKQVKNKIIATQKTGQVTKAMEAVSAVKMRKSQEKALTSRPYVHAALRILSRVAASQDGLSHQLAQYNSSKQNLLVIVTSDKGLAGGVNSAVLKKVEEYCKENPNTDTICIGRKAVDFANREKKKILAEFVNVSDEISVDDVFAMTNTVTDSFKKEEYGQVYVIYQNFLSTFEQEPTRRQVLPLDPAELHSVMKGIRPKTGKFSDETVLESAVINYTVEPSPEAVLETLIPQLVQIMIFHALIESKACEHSARMVAMKNATDKTKEVVKDLTILYNKERQSAITAEVSEITAGAEAMK